MKDDGEKIQQVSNGRMCCDDKQGLIENWLYFLKDKMQQKNQWIHTAAGVNATLAHNI